MEAEGVGHKLLYSRAHGQKGGGPMPSMTQSGMKSPTWLLISHA